MYRESRVLAVVPARGGSKGIPLKNLRTVAGVPLVGRAGLTLAALPWVDRAVVSTDHEQIASVAEQHGLAAPFRRPESLSGAVIGDWDVLDHALTTMEALDGQRYDIILMLQPTSPSREPSDVERAVELLLDGDFDAVWSVSETDSKGHPLKQFVVGADSSLNYYDPAGAAIIARQQLKPVYHRDGIVYAFTRACIAEQRTIRGRRLGALVIDRPVANIDTELDLAWAEFLWSRRTQN
jgi:CMP-N,N'-diacetyllegionaminic acid synthase